jgi:hypothetical protein
MSENDLEQPLPWNRDAERSVLGAVLVHNPALATAIASGLTVEDFYQSQHKTIFRAMLGLGSDPIDAVILTDLLHREGKLDAAGGPEYIAQLMDGVHRAINIGHYARIVRKKSTLRRAISLADAIKNGAFSGEIDAGKVAELTALENGNIGDSWRTMFHTADDFKNAPSLRFAIDGFLQLDGATLFGGLAGHGKTFVMLSLVKALLSGEKLFGHFSVSDIAPRVVYLIPESALGPFGHRLKLFGLTPYLENERLLVRTLSMGATPCLADPRILAAAKGADVFLDTAVRFAQGDENSASDNQRGLASDIFALLGAGAREVVGAHHSAKAFGKETAITLENVLRGSGDVGAMVVSCYGIKQIDAMQNVIHVECVKARDFQPGEPFQIQGRPHIDERGDFRMYKEPGRCGRLADEQPDINRGGAPDSLRESKAANQELLRTWLTENPQLSSRELSKRFSDVGIKVNDSTIRHYRKDLRL